MLNFKSLTTGVAAAALVSGIGLAYAQTPAYPPAASDTPATTTAPAPMEPAVTVTPRDTSTPSSTTPMGANDAPSGNVAEPEPKADRN